MSKKSCTFAVEFEGGKSISDISEKKLGLAYIGKRDLLLAGRKLPLVCHRADAECIEEQTRAVMNAAQQGAVIVSAFISAHEREIRKQLLSKRGTSLKRDVPRNERTESSYC